jgi:hypothetical protein
MLSICGPSTLRILRSVCRAFCACLDEGPSIWCAARRNVLFDVALPPSGPSESLLAHLMFGVGACFVRFYPLRTRVLPNDNFLKLYPRIAADRPASCRTLLHWRSDCALYALCDMRVCNGNNSISVYMPIREFKENNEQCQYAVRHQQSSHILSFTTLTRYNFPSLVHVTTLPAALPYLEGSAGMRSL